MRCNAGNRNTGRVILYVRNDVRDNIDKKDKIELLVPYDRSKRENV